MMRDIERRLQNLESQAPPPQPTERERVVQILHWFFMCAVAFYLGDPTPGGSLVEAYMRALGYSHGFEFQNALDAKDPDFFERDRLARIKLLEKFGVSWEHEWNEIGEAFDRMEAGFSERYKENFRGRLPSLLGCRKSA
jgi:hypothetical protein